MLRPFFQFNSNSPTGNLESRMHNLTIMLLMLHSLSFLILSAAGALFTHSFKKALAVQIGIGMRRNLVTADLRQASPVEAQELLDLMTQQAEKLVRNVMTFKQTNVAR